MLVVTIIIQLSAGLAIHIGYKGRFCFAFLLADLTLVISVYMHKLSELT